MHRETKSSYFESEFQFFVKVHFSGLKRKHYLSLFSGNLVSGRTNSKEFCGARKPFSKNGVIWAITDPKPTSTKTTHKTHPQTHKTHPQPQKIHQNHKYHQKLTLSFGCYNFQMKRS